jgi:predicted regulator of Ras-like GTPase activity (Roadblock/LC7/MglB family)
MSMRSKSKKAKGGAAAATDGLVIAGNSTSNAVTALRAALYQPNLNVGMATIPKR